MDVEIYYVKNINIVNNSFDNILLLLYALIMKVQDEIHVASLSIRELTRSGKTLQEFDYIDIEDRKSHEYKGVFVPQSHAADVKEFLSKKLKRERQEKERQIMKFAGIAKGETGGKTYRELATEKAGKYIK